MQRKKLDKMVAGYHLLMILSAVDFKFHIEEEKIIREYLFQHFPENYNLDNEIHTIASLSISEWKSHFIRCMEDFTTSSSLAERNELLKFAVYLSKADERITVEENEYLQILFEQWDFSRE